MSVARFDDRPYGKLITARIINAYGCEYCYFTPTREAADLGGQLEVPTLNLIGTADEFFGPPASDGWTGSIAARVAANTESGWGDTPTGNAYTSFLRQGVRTGLVATFVGAEHDGTLAADNALRDVLLSFLSAPLRCTELLEQWQETEYLNANTTLKARCVPEERLARGEGVDVRAGSSLLWVEIDQKHGIPADVPYGLYKTYARRWGRARAHGNLVRLIDTVKHAREAREPSTATEPAAAGAVNDVDNGDTSSLQRSKSKFDAAGFERGWSSNKMLAEKAA